MKFAGSIVVALALVWIAASIFQRAEHDLAAGASPAGESPTPRALEQIKLLPASASEFERVVHDSIRWKAEARAPTETTERLVGRLVDVDAGWPGPKGEVWWIESDGTGEPLKGGGRAPAELDRDGRFQLAPPAWALGGASMLIGRAPGRLPAVRFVAAREWESGAELLLQLEEGVELRGRVTCGGAPVGDRAVDLDLRFGVPGVLGAGREGFWLGGRFVEKTARTVTAEDGSFRFTGLARDTYDLRCSRMTPALPGVLTRRVAVDGNDVQIELEAVIVEVLVTSNGTVVDGAEISVTRAGESLRITSAKEPVSVTVVGGMPIVFRATHPAYADREVEISLDAQQRWCEVTIEVEPVTRPALWVRLPGASSEGIDSIELDLLECRLGAKERRLQLSERIAHDTFSLAVLQAVPGLHDLRLRSVGPFRSEVVRLEVPVDGVVLADFTGLRGGGYEVSLHSARETWSATWWIEDGSGVRVTDPRQHHRQSGSAMEFDTVWSNSVGGSLPSLRPDRERIPAGNYTLVVESGGHRPHRQEFLVQEGQVVRLDVSLASTVPE